MSHTIKKRYTLNASTPGYKLSVDVFPSPIPSSYTLLFGNATGFHKELWDPIILNIGKKYNFNCTCITYDLRNHGDSAQLNAAHASPVPFTWRTNVSDVLYIINQLELKKNKQKLIGIGHSISGCCFAALEQIYPNTFDKLILIDPIIHNGVGGRDLASLAEKRRSTWKNREDAKVQFRSNIFWKKWDDEMLDIYVEFGLKEKTSSKSETDLGSKEVGLEERSQKVTLKTSPKEEAATFRGLHDFEKVVWRRLPEIMIPVLWIVGDKSDFLEVEKARENSERCEVCKLEVLEEVGHLVPMEAPRAVERLVVEWVRPSAKI